VVLNAQVSDSNGLQSSVAVQGKINRFSPDKELAIFRMVQELTNNILKHAHAAYINYALIKKNGDALKIFVEHNGNGLNQAEYEEKLYGKEGLGLKNIQNRLNILKASIRFERNNEYISSISLNIPLNT